jgi:hypothetical protein
MSRTRVPKVWKPWDTEHNVKPHKGIWENSQPPSRVGIALLFNLLTILTREVVEMGWHRLSTASENTEQIEVCGSVADGTAFKGWVRTCLQSAMPSLHILSCIPTL